MMPNYNYPYQYMYQNPQNPQQFQQQAQPQMPQQIQNCGFISVPNEEMVLTYPVGPGNCVTFKIEGKPIVMEKSMGFSQFENPRIDKYRLIKDDTFSRAETPQIGNTPPELDIISKKDFSCEIDKLWCEIQALKDAKNDHSGGRRKDREGGQRNDRKSQ